MKIFDHEGTERDAAWLEARFGAVNVRSSTADSAFRVHELRESIGPAVYVVVVLDEHGARMDGELVARHWPYREENHELPPLPENEWFTRGVYGPTEGGDIGFGSGGGDYYDPTGQMEVRGVPLGTVGASSFWVLEWPSDCIEGIGTLGGTNHAHLDMVFQWVEGSEPPPPPPPPPPPECNLDVELFRAEMEAAISALRAAMDLVAESHGG
jgi:hypothetical protein